MSLTRENAEKYPLSAPVLDRWAATDHQPTENEKAQYWRLHAKDICGIFKTVKNQIILALAVAFWAKEKAHKLEDRADDLERRLLALERRLESERKGFFYRGVFTEGEHYEEGDFVTDRGGLWHCNAPTTTRPGSSADWQLAVKAGRNGRDAR